MNIPREYLEKTKHWELFNKQDWTCDLNFTYFQRQKLIFLWSLSSKFQCTDYVCLSSLPILNRIFYVTSEDCKLTQLLQEGFRTDCPFMPVLQLQGTHPSETKHWKNKIHSSHLGLSFALLWCAGSTSTVEWYAQLQINGRKWQSHDSSKEIRRCFISAHISIQW